MSKFTKEHDVKVLKNIQGRLVTEVGEILEIIENEWLSGGKSRFSTGYFPYWSSLRMSMPIAESIGSLLYNKNTSSNLIDFFQKEMAQINDGYGKFKYTISELYRHPLIHSDEMRGIQINKTHIGWSLDVSDRSKHLKIIKIQKKRSAYFVHFNPPQFYEDIESRLQNLILRAELNEWNGKLAKNYDSWLRLNFNDKDVQKGPKKNSYHNILNEIKLLNKNSK